MLDVRLTLLLLFNTAPVAAMAARRSTNRGLQWSLERLAASCPEAMELIFGFRITKNRCRGCRTGRISLPAPPPRLFWIIFPRGKAPVRHWKAA